jgi:hypothetical protein
VGSKTFFLREGVWTDAEFDPERMTPVRVQFGSDAYFDLLAARPEWGPYLALGDRVVFVAEGTAYEVTAEEAGPVVIPPTRPPTPTPGPAASPTLSPSGPTPPAPGGGFCPGIGALLLAVLMLARRSR